MKLQFGPLFSDIFISVYIVITLYLRFEYESQLQLTPLNSFVMGVAFLVMILVLMKFKILNPNWFGLFNSKNKKA